MLHSLGQNHGTHSFVVQLRDMKTHEPLPGRSVYSEHLTDDAQ